MKYFDLNIDKILENWTAVHACRELIANALDESILSDSAPPNIEKRDADICKREINPPCRIMKMGLKNENLANCRAEVHAVFDCYRTWSCASHLLDTLESLY